MKSGASFKINLRNFYPFRSGSPPILIKLVVYKSSYLQIWLVYNVFSGKPLLISIPKLSLPLLLHKAKSKSELTDKACAIVKEEKNDLSDGSSRKRTPEIQQYRWQTCRWVYIYMITNSHLLLNFFFLILFFFFNCFFNRKDAFPTNLMRTVVIVVVVPMMVNMTFIDL